MVWQQVANLSGEISCGGSSPLISAKLEEDRLDEELVLKTSSGNHSVVGSSPTSSSFPGPVAQLDPERFASNEEAAGSSPAGFTYTGVAQRQRRWS